MKIFKQIESTIEYNGFREIEGKGEGGRRERHAESTGRTLHAILQTKSVKNPTDTCGVCGAQIIRERTWVDPASCIQ